MYPVLTLTLEAHHADNDHHRRYELSLGQDLLGYWMVTIRYGRIGQGGQERRYASAKPEDMRAVVCERLRRRSSAPRRIGCPYRVVGLSAAPGFDPGLWLPDGVIAPFLAAKGGNEGKWAGCNADG